MHDLTEHLKNPYVLGGLAALFVVIMVVQRSGGSGAAALDPNAALAAQTNVQLSKISAETQSIATQANAATAQLAVKMASANYGNELAAYTANSVAQAQYLSAGQASLTSQFHDAIAGATAQAQAIAAIQINRDQTVAAMHISDNAMTVSTTQAAVAQNIASINGSVQATISANQLAAQQSGQMWSTIGTFASLAAFAL